MMTTSARGIPPQVERAMAGDAHRAAGRRARAPVLSRAAQGPCRRVPAGARHQGGACHGERRGEGGDGRGGDGGSDDG